MREEPLLAPAEVAEAAFFLAPPADVVAVVDEFVEVLLLVVLFRGNLDTSLIASLNLPENEQSFRSAKVTPRLWSFWIVTPQ